MHIYICSLSNERESHTLIVQVLEASSAVLFQTKAAQIRLCVVINSRNGKRIKFYGALVSAQHFSERKSSFYFGPSLAISGNYLKRRRPNTRCLNIKIQRQIAQHN